MAVNQQDSQGCTALHYAASKGHLEVCHVLLDHWRFKAHNTQELRIGGVGPLKGGPRA